MIRAGKQTGYILLPVIVVITLVAAIALLMNTESALESNTAATELDAQQALYVAEAGLNHALWLNRQQGCGPYSELTDEPLGSDDYSSKLTTDLGSTSTFTINVDQDSWIRDDFPTNNYAADPKLHVRNQGGVIEHPLIRFDVSSLAAKAPILSATAWFYVNKAHAAGPVRIHRILADWNEADVTWNSFASAIDSAALAVIPAQPSPGIWVSVNLTSQVQAWVNGEPNYGIALSGANDGIQGEYSSRESSNAPFLEIVTGTPPTPSATLKADGKLANGVDRSVQRTVELVQAPRSMMVLQPGATVGIDSYIWIANPNTNYGTDDETWVSTGSTNESLSLLRFNLDAVPRGAKIHSAVLSMHQRSSNDTNVAVGAHRITNEWDEAYVDWFNNDNSGNWVNPGGDYDPDPIATTLVGPTTMLRHEWDITPLVQDWVGNRATNNGVVLRTETPGSLGERFDTSDHADPTRHPRLTISYSCECGIVCVPPQSSGKILFVVDGLPTLTAREANYVSVFEAMGYSVDLIADYEVLSDFSGKAATSDVVFVSRDLDPGQFGLTPALLGTSLGVVVDKNTYVNDLGFGSAVDKKPGDTVVTLDTAHDITRVFPADALRIYDGGMNIRRVTGTASGAQVLAQHDGVDTIITLDTGAVLGGDVTGLNAAGRRVMLPFISGDNFNEFQINNNGWLLLQRSLDWAIGKKKTVPTNSLLMVVVDPSSLTPQETVKKALIESWDYIVNLIDESDSQVNFDAAVAANDVVYITEDVNSTTVGTKLVNATVGVVTEEDNLSDEFGFSDSIHWGSGTALNIDNTHYITLPLSLGNVTILTASESLADLTGALAPDIQILGQSTDGPALAAIEAGDSLILGGTAMGRRVILPWGGNDFDVNHLNDDGRTILRRSLEWASGLANLTGPLAHWKLDETSGLDAIDSVSGHDGILQNGPGWAGGVLGGGLDFDGVNDEIDVGPETELDDVFASGATLSGWFNARGWGEGSYGRIADKSNATYPGAGWAFELYGPAQALLFQVGYTGATGSWATPAGSISLDTWHHVAVVFDSSDSANDPTIYIDGVAQTVNELDTPTGTPEPDGSFDLNIGNHAQATVRTFDGVLDDIRIYDRLLSADEIEDLATLPGPVAHWKLDDGTGLTAIDSEGGNDGTLTGVPAWVAGLGDGGLDFDGSGDYVDAGTFDVTGSGITMMGWFNAEAIATDDGRFVSKASGPNEADAYWQLSTTDSGSNRYLRMRVKAGGTTTTLADSSVNLTTGSWYFAVGTYDTASGMMRLYLNGVEVASTAHAIGGALDTDPSAPVAIGANGTAERFFNGILDDVRVYNRALGTGEIQDLYDASAPLPPGFTELYEPWSATVDATWQTVDLAPFGVPENTVVEVAMVNAKNKNERWGGVRAVGSGLDRRLRLHEAEGGGVDALTMHVQADSASQIQHYSEKKGELTFILLGYWAGASYTELMEPFTADSSNSWVEENLADDGLGPNQVAEIVMLNTNSGNERLAGVRPSGTTYQRRFNLHEAESGGVDAVTMMVNTDASSIAEVFASNATDVDFYVVGYWSTPPGTYTETGGVHGQASAASTWEQANLATFGVPADSVAQFVVSTEVPNFERRLGVRELGSTNNRTIELQEAEEGGADNASMHVNVDASSQIEWYSQDGTSERFFYPVGWWVLSP